MKIEKNNFFEEFSKFFNVIRKKRGMTMMDVSNQTGLSTGYLSDIENRLEERLGVPRKASLTKLLDCYNLTEEEEKEYFDIIINLLIENYLDKERATKIREYLNIKK